MKVTVGLSDPEDEVVADIDARDRRAFERRGRKDAGLPLTGALREVTHAHPETYTLWLCWHALVVRGDRKDLGDFRAFEARALETSSAEVMEEPFGDPTSRPTSEGRSPG